MAGRLNFEKNSLYINKFMTGLYKRRSPLFTPLSSMGLQIIQRQDSFWDGQNMDVSHDMTVIRRPGFTRYCSTALSGSNYPQQFYSFKNVAGTIKALVETATAVSYFTSSSLTQAFPKTGTAQGSLNKVGDMLYYCDGTDADTIKWDGTTLSKWGIVAPALAPTITFAGGTLTTTNGGYTYLYVYKNSATGHMSSSSPVSAATLNLTAQDVTLSGASSTDSQVDKVDIFRTDDGGAVYYYLAEVANTPGSNWTYTDSTVDSGLNDFIVVTPGESNNPPPTGSRLSCFYQGRFWIAAGKYLYFSGGPDITYGVPEECFPPANVFTLPDSIKAFAPTSQGLMVFTQSECYLVLGNSTLTYYLQEFQRNFGVMSQNCIAQDGDLVNVFTSTGQLFQLSGSLTEIGYQIQAQLAAFNPANTYLALHRSGVDEGLFVCDGSANMYRYSMSINSWSTVYNPVGGCGAIGSIEATTANYQLMMGRATGGNYILSRNLTTYQDDGTSYPCFVTLGSIVMAPPGEVQEITSILIEAFPRGTYPTVSALINEVSGTFTPLPNPVNDPPFLDGSPFASTTVWSKRHYISGANSALQRAQVRHIQLKLSFVAENVATEIMGVAIQ